MHLLMSLEPQREISRAHSLVLLDELIFIQEGEAGLGRGVPPGSNAVSPEVSAGPSLLLGQGPSRAFCAKDSRLWKQSSLYTLVEFNTYSHTYFLNMK